VTAVPFPRQHLFAGFVSAVIFGVGLVVAGMTSPSKVVGFLDVFGRWDPSLALVMIGAIGVHAVMYRLIRRRPSPLFGDGFHIPHARSIDARLVVGAAMFGVGWGLSGICPGPGLVTSFAAAVAGGLPLLAFIAAMLVGMKLFGVWTSARRPG
jgi:uncharacterized membrane protein YedE/YeeE